jgi:regulator of sigma E protease
MQAALSGFLSWAVLGLPAFLFVITLVVFIHELGHFLVARWCGVAVDVFSVGFGRELLGFTDRRGTRWRISALPLGGYVKFAGDADAASRPDAESLNKMDARTRADALYFKPLHQRAFVAAAGPFANFILAIVIFMGLALALGKAAAPPVLETVTKDSAAERAGLQPGDIIRSVDGKTVNIFADLQSVVEAKPGEPIQVVVSRGGREMTFEATPTSEQATDEAGVKHTVGRLGVRDATVPVGVVEAFQVGVESTWIIFRETLTYLVKIATGQESPGQLHGILGIGAVSDQAARIGFAALLRLAGLMSVSIGLINLLPIPVLDGGHLLYYGCEAILRRPLGERAQEVGFRLGLAFVLGLILLATFNDLVRFNLF